MVFDQYTQAFVLKFVNIVNKMRKMSTIPFKKPFENHFADILIVKEMS
jgi:hypothetical protein